MTLDLTDDPLTDPALSVPRRQPGYDPAAGHRAHMERIGQEQWVRDACARAFDRPIEEVEADLERRRLESEREAAAARVERKPAAKKAPAKKASPPPAQRKPKD